MTFFALLAFLGFVALCFLAVVCRDAMPEPAVGIGLAPEPTQPTGRLVVWRGQHVEDMRFLTGPVPALQLPASAPDVCPICHCHDCDSSLANCLERWR